LLGRPSARAAEARESRQVTVAGESQLFLDDHLIESSTGLERIVHQPSRQGLIEEADGASWERGDAPAVVRDAQGRFHLYYRFLWEDPSVRDLHPGIGNDRAHWFRRTVGYAVSDDGIRWSKPVLRLFDGPTGFRTAPREMWKDGVFLEPSGISRENNLGCPINHVQDLGQFGGVADPQQRYLVNVIDRQDSHNFAEIAAAGLYFAADVPDFVGDPDWRRTMTAVWEGPRRGPRGEATHVAGYSSADDEWFVCTQSRFGAWAGAEVGRTISRFASRDLLHWSDEEPVFQPLPDEPRTPQDWVEYMDISAYRAGSAWIGQLVVFHGDRTSDQYQMPDPRTGRPNGVWRKGTTDVQLVVSRDAGHTWQRVGPRAAWIPHHAAEDGYDRLAFAGSPVRVGDELWLYYMCFDGDHLVWNLDGTTYYKDRTRIGRIARATLRWDGYASLRPVDRQGTLLTRPLVSYDRRLFVNAAARDGSVRAAVIARNGESLAGYSLEDCLPLTGDGVAQEVRWRNAVELPGSTPDRPLQLQFELAGAELFGFEIAG
jgi:hypothetical protein